MRRITDIKEIQDLALRILKQFDEFCKEYNIKYFLSGGTLIGAIRHQGFIPWDDDIDVWITREEFNKVVALFPEWGKKRGLYLNSTQTNPKYNRVFAKICMEHTHLDSYDRHNDYEEGYFIDLFIIDGSPNNAVLRWMRVTRLQLLRNIVTLSAYGADQLPDASIKQKIYGFIGRLFRKIDQHKYTCKFEKIASKSSCAKSDYLQIVVKNSKGRAILMPSSWFKNTELMPFEDIQAMVPVGYDKILRSMYGDYMKLPPEDQRKSVHVFGIYIDD